MFMPEETESAPGGGSIHGAVSRPPQTVMEPGGLFSRPRSVTMFRLNVDGGRELNCLFPGILSAPLDLGDRIEIRGYVHRGVLQVTRINDENGAEIARAGCFVVTVALGDEQALDVVLLRRFRDEVLLTSGSGRAMIAAYSRVGPWLAERIAGRPLLCYATRSLIVWPLRILAQRRLSPAEPETELRIRRLKETRNGEPRTR